MSEVNPSTLAYSSPSENHPQPTEVPVASNVDVPYAKSPPTVVPDVSTPLALPSTDGLNGSSHPSSEGGLVFVSKAGGSGDTNDGTFNDANPPLCVAEQQQLDQHQPVVCQQENQQQQHVELDAGQAPASFTESHGYDEEDDDLSNSSDGDNPTNPDGTRGDNLPLKSRAEKKLEKRRERQRRRNRATGRLASHYLKPDDLSKVLSPGILKNIREQHQQERSVAQLTAANHVLHGIYDPHTYAAYVGGGADAYAAYAHGMPPHGGLHPQQLSSYSAPFNPQNPLAPPQPQQAPGLGASGSGSWMPLGGTSPAAGSLFPPPSSATGSPQQAPLAPPPAYSSSRPPSFGADMSPATDRRGSSTATVEAKTPQSMTQPVAHAPPQAPAPHMQAIPSYETLAQQYHAATAHPHPHAQPPQQPYPHAAPPMAPAPTHPQYAYPPQQYVPVPPAGYAPQQPAYNPYGGGAYNPAPQQPYAMMQQHIMPLQPPPPQQMMYMPPAGYAPPPSQAPAYAPQAPPPSQPQYYMQAPQPQQPYMPMPPAPQQYAPYPTTAYAPQPYAPPPAPYGYAYMPMQ